MFSPIGYHSYVRAFAVVKEHYERCDVDFGWLFSAAFEHDGGAQSSHLAKIYSQQEVLERTFSN